MILWSTYLGNGRIQPFVYFSIVFCLYRVLHTQRDMSSNFFVYHISESFSLRFPDFFFYSTVSIPSSLHYPSLECSRIEIVFSVVSSVISKEFLSRFLKCSLPLWSLSSWKAAFSFALVGIFLSLYPFTVCHATPYRLCFIEFLILLIWFSNLFSSSFLVCIISLRAFLSFWRIGICWVSFIK